MKILLLHQHYYPEMAGTARRTKELAEEFVNMGHCVSVLTTFPREFRSMPGESAYSYEKINGVQVFRVNTYFDVGSNVPTRVLSYLLFVLLSIKWMAQNRKEYEILISIAPIASGVVGAITSKIYGVYHHFDVPDILPDLGIAAGMIKNKYIIGIFYYIEKLVYNNSNSISAITEGQVSNIIGKGVSPAKLHLIPDWVDSDYFSANTEKYRDIIENELKTKFGDKKIISFIGNIGVLQNPTIFLDMIKQINTNSTHRAILLFIGDGIMLQHLKSRVKNEGIKNVEFIGRVPREEVPAYMNCSDILLANYVNNSYMEICIPGKLYEYIISNTPILVGAKGEVARMISQYSAGIVVEPSNPSQMKAAACQILDSNNYRESIKVNEFRKKYSLSTVAVQYNQIFNLAIKSKE